MRREKLENLIVTEMMSGRHSRGRRIEKQTDGMAKWLGLESEAAMLQNTKMRQEWKRLIINAREHDT